MDIALVLGNQKDGLEVLSEGQLLVNVSPTWWFSDSSASWLGASLLPMVF